MPTGRFRKDAIDHESVLGREEYSGLLFVCSGEGIDANQQRR